MYSKNIDQTYEEKLATLMTCEKEELAKMLIECNKHLDFHRPKGIQMVEIDSDMQGALDEYSKQNRNTEPKRKRFGEGKTNETKLREALENIVGQTKKHLQHPNSTTEQILGLFIGDAEKLLTNK